MAVVRYLHEQCDYDDIVAMVAEGGKLPFQVLLQTISEPTWCDEYWHQRRVEMAGYYAEQQMDFDLMSYKNKKNKK